MNNPDYIPIKNAEFYEWIARLVNRLADGVETWSIPPAAYADLRTRFDVYDVAYNNTLLRVNSTPAAIHHRNALQKDLKAAVRRFVKMYLRYNPAVTDSNLVGLGLPVYSDKRHPTPVPTTQPVLKVDTSIDSQLSVFYQDSVKTGKSKPAGVHGCEIKWVLGEEVIVSYDDFIHSTFDTRSPVLLRFDINQQGVRIHLVARWQNTRGEKGPWSAVVSAVIP